MSPHALDLAAMDILLILLALVLLAGGIALLVVDARRRRAPERPEGPAPDELGVVPVVRDDVEGDATPAPAEEDAEDRDVAVGSADPGFPAEVDKLFTRPVRQRDPEPGPEPEEEQDALDVVKPEPSDARPVRRRGAFTDLADRLRSPQQGRRARKAWARERGGEYVRVDPALSGMWLRMPEGQAHDVVAGFAHGRELRMADIGGHTIIALRRDVASDVVVEFARDRGPGLTVLAEAGGASAATNDPAVVTRLLTPEEIDSAPRMPLCIDALWVEGEWAIARLADGSVPEDWDAALPAVAEFADVARRLPPADGGELLDVTAWDPTRPSADDPPATAGSGASGAAASAGAPMSGPVDRHLRIVPDRAEVPEPAVEEPVWRPELRPMAEPIDLPSRSVATRMGDGEFRDLGSDPAGGLPALGEDPDHVRTRARGGRVLRRGDRPSGIFADATADDGGTNDQTDQTDKEDPQR